MRLSCQKKLDGGAMFGQPNENTIRGASKSWKGSSGVSPLMLDAACGVGVTTTTSVAIPPPPSGSIAMVLTPPSGPGPPQPKTPAAIVLLL